MTPEELAEAAVERVATVVIHQWHRGIFTGAEADDVRRPILAAIRAAVLEEREACAAVAGEVQRCTCPATPGHTLTTHTRWCPWGIAAAIRSRQ